jgi:hypothetical protein
VRERNRRLTMEVERAAALSLGSDVPGTYEAFPLGA